MAYCDYQQAQINKTIQESINKGERVPAEAKALNKTVGQTKAILMSGCQSGQITPQEYCDILKQLQRKDQALAKFFNQYKDTDPEAKRKLMICMTRFKIVKGELAEL